ncbi:MAG: Omp28-related outer membrane protein, partial [bacterium]|nr:Omp28-related outer membrane protein [Candidatus Limimorpha equi]
MKKIFLALLAVLAFSFSLKAQQYVSTTPSNRNVILEEFTGRNCGYCTDGHRIGNEIMAEFPGRFWAINVHDGGYAPTSYPNFNTTDGHTIASGFSISGYPTGNVNRSSNVCQDRGQWRSIAVQQMGQAAECNIGGMVVVNPASRIATITVEVYYTGNSTVDENYLTVAMLQDSILGSQADYGNYNPGQWVGSQYCHMHIFRDVVNSTSAWGDAISPTTAGTLITRTYTYEIPETIGSPNGVDVDLDNIIFIAYVTERFQGTPTRPVLTANELDMVTGSDEPIFPFIKSVAQEAASTCTHSKIVNVKIQNGGTETLTSLKLEAEIEGETVSMGWEGELPQYGIETIEIPVEVPFGSHSITV